MGSQDFGSKDAHSRQGEHGEGGDRTGYTLWNDGCLWSVCLFLHLENISVLFLVRSACAYLSPIHLVEVLPLIQLQCPRLQTTSFAVYLTIHGLSQWTHWDGPSRSGVREGAGSGPVCSTVPHPGASTPGRVSQPRAAPASSRPLCSTLFRAPGAINRGSHSLGEPPPSLLGPPASPARRDRRHHG